MSNNSNQPIDPAQNAGCVNSAVNFERQFCTQFPLTIKAKCKKPCKRAPVCQKIGCDKDCELEFEKMASIEQTTTKNQKQKSFN